MSDATASSPRRPPVDQARAGAGTDRCGTVDEGPAESGTDGDGTIDHGRLAPVLPLPSAARPTPSPGGPSPDRSSSDSTPSPRLREVVGDVLRTERLDQERTLADVASRAAVSLPYLSEVERGVKEVSSDVLAAICDALDLPLADVLDRSARRLRASGHGGSGVMLLAA